MAENQAGIKRGFRYDKENARLEVFVDGSEILRLKNNQASPSGSTKQLEIVGHAESPTAGIRQGALFIDMTRETTMTSADGNPDCALKIQLKEEASGSAYIRARAMDVKAEIDDGYGGVFVNGLMLTCEVGTGGTCTDVTVADFEIKNNGVVTTNIGVLVNDQSQGSATSCYGIKVYTSNYNITRTGAIFINSQGTSGWTSGIIFDGVITNVFEFIDVDGTGGCTTGTYSSGYSEAPTGVIKVKAGSNTKYMYLYTDTITFS